MIEFYDRKIGNNQPPFIIAEACINHEGDITIAKEMIQKRSEPLCVPNEVLINILSKEAKKKNLPIHFLNT